MDDESTIVDDRLRLIFTCCHPALEMPARVALTLRALGGHDDRRDRPRVPGRRADHGQADRAREAQDRRRAHPLPGAGRRGAARPPARRAAGGVPDLQRGLRGHRGRSPRARGAVRRGDPPRRAAVPADARRRRGVGAVGLDAAARRAPRRARGSERPLRRARRPGPVALGSGPDPRGPRDGWSAPCACGVPGEYQLQAAITALQIQAPDAEATDWAQIAELYGALGRLNPSPVVELNRAVAVGLAAGPAAGLELLEPLLGDPALERYQPLHAAHAELLSRAGDAEGAARAYERAIALSSQRRRARGARAAPGRAALADLAGLSKSASAAATSC